ncbi:hypothetical protein DL95DRAFT_403048 [Leptodontidium sp. 2 PMI_412]|nr:hypothetical protein DL95DRAFT_403048 [Leptodontidium sp. 2 PMI_412]
MAPFIWNKACTRPDRPVPITAISTFPQNPINSDESSPKFTVFPRLPSELRIKIWKLALPRRRIITIKGNGLLPFQEDPSNPTIPLIPGYSGPRYEASQDAPPPAILFVNAEAREQALKLYSPIFTYVQQKTVKHVIVYMNFDLDFLYLDGCHSAWVNYVCGVQPDLKKVKNLALGPGIQPWVKLLNWYGTFEDERENDTRFKHFHNLQTLIMSADQPTPFVYEFSDDIQTSDAYKKNMQAIWRAPKTGAKLCGVHGQTLHAPPFMCRLPIEDLVSFDEAECRRRWKEARVKL